MSTILLSRLRLTIGARIYALIALSFVGLIGLSILDSRALTDGLKQQKRIELQHLTEVALTLIKDEYAAAQRGEIPVAEAQKRALARLAALRYGNNDYFVVQDMHPYLIMHPIMPQLNGKDMSNAKDPSGKLFAARRLTSHHCFDQA
jgi:methyl-accepting chemotaxis protein